MPSPVLIIGAGVSGLLLAQGLKKANLPSRVFERDAHLEARTQGYRVRISDEGIQALRDCLSPEHFAKVKRCCSILPMKGNAPSATLDALTARAGVPLFPGGRPSGPPPPVGAEIQVLSVDRRALRAILLQGLEGLTEFGKEYEHYEQDGEGAVTVTFTDGSSIEGSLLVGADGAWSRVRQQLLPEYQLSDTEARPIYGKTPVTDALGAALSSAVLSGLTLLRSPNFSCLLETMRFDHSQPETPPDYVYWVLFLKGDAYQEDAIPASTEDTLHFAQKATSDWHDSFRCLFTQPGSGASVVHLVTSRPSALAVSTAKDALVVLIGDAAHAMAPTAALGATTALRDAGNLVRQLTLRTDVVAKPAAALRAYEREMEVYAADALERSMMGAKIVFGIKPFDELPLVDTRGS
ncbi:hypothetical protein LTR36_003285 [Oleoguttula mirabilis]|uniref:FAD-binding domain-containing protein n=1 Tax=Oleoguttula mirabilis TaxID=1507867 RepID=A0AAV9JXF6_9PEZI|nr:hypothetical protein LTR36_003285 [Oleoguttula mirabilis]